MNLFIVKIDLFLLRLWVIFIIIIIKSNWRIVKIAVYDLANDEIRTCNLRTRDEHVCYGPRPLNFKELKYFKVFILVIYQMSSSYLNTLELLL